MTAKKKQDNTDMNLVVAYGNGFKDALKYARQVILNEAAEVFIGGDTGEAELLKHMAVTLDGRVRIYAAEEKKRKDSEERLRKKIE